MKKLAILAGILLLLPALWLSDTGAQAKGPVTFTLWYPAGEITAEAANNCKVEVVPIDRWRCGAERFRPRSWSTGKASGSGSLKDSIGRCSGIPSCRPRVGPTSWAGT
jgi:hypothetical protein